MQKHFAGRITAIIVVLGLGLFGIFPGMFKLDFSYNLKPGIDIAGGTSLLYEISVPPGETAPADLSERVAESLKKRVDPEGVRNLIWRPQGPTRLEIQMPLTPQSQQAIDARRVYNQAQKALDATNIRMTELDAALEDEPAKRKAELDHLALDSAKRKQLLAETADAQDKYRQALKDNNVDLRLDMEDKLAKLRKAVEDTNLDVKELQTLLALRQDAIDRAAAGKDRRALEKAIADRNAQVKEKIASRFPGFPSRQKAIDELVKASDEFMKYKGAVDDAEDLKRLLRGSGVLEFHILVTTMDSPEARAMVQRLQEKGPTPQAGDKMRWYEVDRPDQMRGHDMHDYAGRKWVLSWITPELSMVHKEGTKPWGLQRAGTTYQQSGEAVVSFQFDVQGAALFGDLTRRNVGRPLAIMLDDKVISAPNIRSPIEGGSGIIEGNYSEAELKYLVSTLNAGSLPARLADQPISERTVGPQLGKDNLYAGLLGCLMGLVVVTVFLSGYYFLAGFVAAVAVLINMVIILGVMAMFNATFTLPALAGVALTLGSAVDANVLIFERLREEQARGLSLRLAMHNAYDRAFSAILDSNVITIVTSVVLYWLGSEEVKGFGLTLLIGILSSLFTALFVTRTVFDILIEKFNVRELGSLPRSFPRWDELLKPKIDWMGKSWFFIAFSGILIVGGGLTYILKGRDMYDVEFVAGTAVQLELKPQNKMSRPQVQELINRPEFEKALPGAQVVAIGNDELEYEVVTPNDNAQEVKAAILKAMEGKLNIEEESNFRGALNAAKQPSSLEAARAAGIVLPIPDTSFKVDNFAPPSVRQHIGGIAIVLRDLDPKLTARQIAARIEKARLQPDRVNQPYREVHVDVRGDPTRATDFAVVLISDGSKREDWEVAANESWKMVVEAITRPPVLQKVTNFSPQVARDTLFAAIGALTISCVLIMIYVWARFGNLKYGSATVVAMLHDVVIVIGAIGLTHIFANTWIGQHIFLLEPFRMNLTLVAAVLTVMGYSMMDTIVVFDRVRENRGKYGHVSRGIINDSVNQTLSRTLLTGGTTLATVFIMYVFGGTGIHGFTFALLVGIVVGTYSSIAVASPLLLIGEPQKAPAGPVPVPAKPVGGTATPAA